MSEMDKDIINELCKNITVKIRRAEQSSDEAIANILAKFELLKGYTKVILADLAEVVGSQGQAWLCLLAISETFKTVRAPEAEKEITQFELAGLVFMKNDYGRVYIRHETLLDKALDLFTHADVDFNNYPEFSKKYYVVSNDPQGLRYKMSASFMDVLTKYADLKAEIEIEGKLLMVRTRKPYTPENGLAMAELTSAIYKSG